LDYVVIFNESKLTPNLNKGYGFIVIVWYEKQLLIIKPITCMKKRKEISLLGALVICVVVLVLHKVLNLEDTAR